MVVAVTISSIAVTLACGSIVDPDLFPTGNQAGALYRAALARLPSLIGISLLAAILVVPLFILVPLGVFLAVRWSMVFYAVIVDRRGPIPALRESWQLTRGSFWHTFGVLLVAAMLGGVFSYIVDGLFLAIGVILRLLLNSSTALEIVTSLANGLSALLVTPFTTAIYVMLFFELKSRAGGSTCSFGHASSVRPNEPLAGRGRLRDGSGFPRPRHPGRRGRANPVATEQDALNRALGVVVTGLGASRSDQARAARDALAVLNADPVLAQDKWLREPLEGRSPNLPRAQARIHAAIAALEPVTTSRADTAGDRQTLTDVLADPRFHPRDLASYLPTWLVPVAVLVAGITGWVGQQIQKVLDDAFRLLVDFIYSDLFTVIVLVLTAVIVPTVIFLYVRTFRRVLVGQAELANEVGIRILSPVELLESARSAALAASFETPVITRFWQRCASSRIGSTFASITRRRIASSCGA